MQKKSVFTLFTTTALIALSLILSACGPAEPVTVEVTLTEFGIESSLSTFEAGQTYSFVITNKGALAHEFVIAEPLMEGAEHDDSMGDSMDDSMEEAGHDDDEDSAEHDDDADTEDHSDDMKMSHEGLILEVEEDQLPAGATVTVEVTFPEEAPADSVEFACHISGHYEGGMHSPITIN